MKYQGWNIFEQFLSNSSQAIMYSSTLYAFFFSEEYLTYLIYPFRKELDSIFI